MQFHPLVTASINHISYRQYDYLTYMTYKHRLSRWLHKRPAHNYVQASMMNLTASASAPSCVIAARIKPRAATTGCEKSKPPWMN